MLTSGSHPAHNRLAFIPIDIHRGLIWIGGKVQYADDAHKKARQGVVGLCRASDVHHKREKKQTPDYILSNRRYMLCTTPHIKQNLLCKVSEPPLVALLPTIF